MGSPRDDRLSPNSGGIADIPALRVCATNGLMHRVKKDLFDHLVSADK